jgi:hypothetical protein
MTLQTVRVVIGVCCLNLWACAWGAPIMTVSIKEADFTAHDQQPMWLDNTHVLFYGYTGSEGVSGKDFHFLNEGWYVWDIDRGTVSKDARFEQAHPECINGQTKSYIVSHSPDGKRSQRRAFVDEEEVPLLKGIWIHPISCRPATTQPPPWVVNGHTSTSKVPLLDEHGYIDRGVDGEDRRSKLPMLYYRTGATQPISLGLESRYVDPNITYYPFVDAYLLRGDRSTQDASPLWLLHPNGRLEQIFSPEGKPWAQIGWTQFLLTKGGLYFISRSHPGLGNVGEAGLYRVQGESIARILPYVVDWGIVSPDGCKLAFIRDRWDANLPGHERYRVQVMNVCEGGANVN